MLDALLIPERNNPHDKNGVRVEIHGRQVGHLSRASAKAYRQQYGETVAGCQVGIFGGEGKHFGVWLGSAGASRRDRPEN